MSLPKKIIFTIVFTLVALVVPGLILLATVDAVNDFSAYIVVYGFILFAMCSYVLVSIYSLSKEVKNAVEEMKMQNAAIAYKITGNIKDDELDEIEEKSKSKEPEKSGKKNKSKSKESANKEEEKVDTSNVNLNPADPLTIDGKVVSDSFDDFK